jgi:hypothetical protein
VFCLQLVWIENKNDMIDIMAMRTIRFVI